jgi:FlaA1/EpsC-like NDP-sugar epimerase
MFDGKRVIVTGGTGSLGSVLVRRLLSGRHGLPEKVVVFSRDEAKQHEMRLEYERRPTATDDVAYGDWRRRLHFRIGDVGDEDSVRSLLQAADLVFNAAALKQVPSCEYFPSQAVRTNVLGAQNIVKVIQQHQLPVEAVVGISTDKACKPVNVMGMTKALQERILIQANLDAPQTRFVAARYGNVLASRGSVIPLFIEQVRAGGPLTLTTPEMTRFLLTLEQAVDTVLAALAAAQPGEIYVPRVPSARITDVAEAIRGGSPAEIMFTGIRPGEKVHEQLVSEEEAYRTVVRGDHYVIQPMLPELHRVIPGDVPLEATQYSSADDVMQPISVVELLRRNGLLAEPIPA